MTHRGNHEVETLTAAVEWREKAEALEAEVAHCGELLGRSEADVTRLRQLLNDIFDAPQSRQQEAIFRALHNLERRPLP